MKTLFWTLLFLFSSITASAYQEIACWDKDCLGLGWTRMDLLHGSFTEYQCYRDGCETSGWIVGGSQNLKFYTQCKAGGCFVDGWYEMDRETQMMNANVVCKNSDCLRFGWISHSGNRSLETTCESQDCRHKGWASQTRLGHSIVSCKNESCFTEGWIESILSF